MKIKWEDKPGYGWRAEPEPDVTLYVSPDRTTGFGTRPKRGTTWRAGVSVWDEASKCISRFGRDIYGTKHPTRAEAMRAAELAYLEAKAPAG